MGMRAEDHIVWNDEEVAMRMDQCRECGISTYQQDRRCVICKIGLRQMHEELMYLLYEDGNIGLLKKLL